MPPWIVTATAHAEETAASATESDCCDDMVMAGDQAGTNQSEPCKSMTLGCMIQMGCLGLSGVILADLGAAGVPISYGVVTYEVSSWGQPGLSTAPDPFPPKTRV